MSGPVSGFEVVVLSTTPISFEDEIAARNARQLAWMTLACGFGNLFWALGDYWLFPEPASRFMAYRIAVFAINIGFVFVAARAQSIFFKNCAIWLWFVAWVISTLPMIPYGQDVVLSRIFVMHIAQWGSGALIVWNWKWGLTKSLTILCIGTASVLAAGVSEAVQGAAIGYLVTGVIFNLVLTTLGYPNAKREYDVRQRLRHERERAEELLAEVTSMRNDRTQWLEKVADFLRHELKNQIDGISISLDLIAMNSKENGHQKYVARANQSLSRIRQLILSAIEATGIESALSVEVMGRVDLGEVVSDRVAIFKNTYRSLQIEYEMGERMIVKGSETRLTQLVDKILGNAVEHLREGGAIRVKTETLGSEAFLRIENDGDPLPSDQSRLFDAFVSMGKPRRSAENLGIGLHVARVIAELHGALLKADNLPDGTGAFFEFRCPLWREQDLLLNEENACHVF